MQSSNLSSDQRKVVGEHRGIKANQRFSAKKLGNHVALQDLTLLFFSSYAKVIDQTGKTPSRDIVIDQAKNDSVYEIRWKSANIINIFGQEVDVTKNSDR